MRQLKLAPRGDRSAIYIHVHPLSHTLGNGKPNLHNHDVPRTSQLKQTRSLVDDDLFGGLIVNTVHYPLNVFLVFKRKFCLFKTLSVTYLFVHALWHQLDINPLSRCSFRWQQISVDMHVQYWFFLSKLKMVKGKNIASARAAQLQNKQ